MEGGQIGERGGLVHWLVGQPVKKAVLVVVQILSRDVAGILVWEMQLRHGDVLLGHGYQVFGGLVQGRADLL